MNISILMPCLNEEKTIEECINKAKDYLARNNLTGEIIIVDNNSTDNSVSKALNLGAFVVFCNKRGYGAALKKGIESCSYDYIIFGDCDCSYDFSNLDAFISAFNHGAEYINGNRFKGGICKGAMSLLHKIGVLYLSGVASLVYKTPLLDYHCGLRGLKKSSFNLAEIKSDGFEFATDIIAYAYGNKLKCCEVPVRLYKDKRNGKSHLNTIRDGSRHLILILRGFLKCKD